MGLNRLREMWLSQEDTGQSYLFSELDASSEEPEPVVRRKKPPREEVTLPRNAPPLAEAPPFSEGESNQLVALLEKCMEVVARDPDVALNGKPVEWETWFSQPLLSTVRRSNLPTCLKQRLLSFLALMLPFLDERERERVQSTLAGIAETNVVEFGDILTEQDLIHSQWLVQAIRKSNDILPQMEGLKRSIIRSIPLCRMA